MLSIPDVEGLDTPDQLNRLLLALCEEKECLPGRESIFVRPFAASRGPSRGNRCLIRNATDMMEKQSQVMPRL